METTETRRRWATDRALADYLECSRPSIWRWVKSGKLPPPHRIGERAQRFDLQEVDAHLAEREAESA